MSSEKTTNLNLHKWTPTDFVQRTEFNDNFEAVDSAVGEVTTQLAHLAIQPLNYSGRGTGQNIPISTAFPKHEII